MNLKEDIKPISYFKSNAAEVLKRINETHNPMIITQNGEARAVLVDTESYDSLVKSIGILKILSEGEKEISSGNLMSQKNVFAEIEKDFGF
jgi:prevent-host-death family protein